MSSLPDPLLPPVVESGAASHHRAAIAQPASAAATGGWSPALDAVRRAWRATPADVDPRTEALAGALRALAREGHARGATVESLLCALDRLTRWVGAADELEPGFGIVRDWAGTVVIRAYFGVG